VANANSTTAAPAINNFSPFPDWLRLPDGSQETVSFLFGCFDLADTGLAGISKDVKARTGTVPRLRRGERCSRSERRRDTLGRAERSRENPDKTVGAKLLKEQMFRDSHLREQPLNEHLF